MPEVNAVFKRAFVSCVQKSVESRETQTEKHENVAKRDEEQLDQNRREEKETGDELSRLSANGKERKDLDDILLI